MPLTYLSHQAIVLPLKLAAPRATNGTALVLGSMAPDVEYYLKGYATSGAWHSWPAQVIVCLPVTLALYWLVTRVIAVPLAAHLPRGGSFRLNDYALVSRQPAGLGHWAIVSVSALIGSSSHVLLDRFTGGWSTKYEADTWPPSHWLPSDSAWITLQLGVWLALGVVTILLLRQIGRGQLLRRWALVEGESSPARASGIERRPLAFWTPIGIAGLVGGTLGALILKPAYYFTDAATWIHIALCAISGAFIGLVAASIAWRLATRNRRSTARESS